MSAEINGMTIHHFLWSLVFGRSDALWEHYIERELEAKNLRFATDLFRRVISIPTKLYNKHWDNFIGRWTLHSSLLHCCSLEKLLCTGMIVFSQANFSIFCLQKKKRIQSKAIPNNEFVQFPYSNIHLRFFPSLLEDHIIFLMSDLLLRLILCHPVHDD